MVQLLAATTTACAARALAQTGMLPTVTLFLPMASTGEVAASVITAVSLPTLYIYTFPTLGCFQYKASSSRF